MQPSQLLVLINASEDLRAIVDNDHFFLHSTNVPITLKEAWMSWRQLLAVSFATRFSPDDCLRFWPPLAGLWVNKGRSIGRQAPTMPKEDSIIAQYTSGLFSSVI